MPYAEILAKIPMRMATELRLLRPSDDVAPNFAASIGGWPAFPDTIKALRSLAQYYKLVVLTDADSDSVAKTVACSLSGITFDAVYTAQEIGSYRPSRKNLEYMLERVCKDFEAPKEKVLLVSQSQYMDCQPAKKMGLKIAWIDREETFIGAPEVFRKVKDPWRIPYGTPAGWEAEDFGEDDDDNESEKDDVDDMELVYDWRFETLDELVQAVDMQRD